MLPPIFQSALPVIEMLEENGFEAYFVGGCVRDYLLKRPVSDIDIATSATPEEVKSVFVKTVDIGIDHGTILVLHHGEFEVTTFRTEGTYSDFRRPDEVAYVRSLREDVNRRDFTINAMAMDRHGRIHDFHNGQRDLEGGTIRTVGNPEERFSEDALRMMRAARFQAQLGFVIDPVTEAAMKKHAGRLSHVAIERCCIEMNKLLSAKCAPAGIETLVKTGLNGSLPGITADAVTIREHFHEPWTVEQGWAVLCLVTGTDEGDFLRKWRHSTKRIQLIKAITGAVCVRRERLFSDWELYRTGLETAVLAEQIVSWERGSEWSPEALTAQAESLAIQSRSELAVNGHKLIKTFNRQPGRWLKTVLLEIEQQVVGRQLPNEQESIIKWVETWLQKSENHS